jgi:hypothetical protein
MKKPENMTKDELELHLSRYEREYHWLKERIAKFKAELDKRQ